MISLESKYFETSIVDVEDEIFPIPPDVTNYQIDVGDTIQGKQTKIISARDKDKEAVFEMLVGELSTYENCSDRVLYFNISSF